MASGADPRATGGDEEDDDDDRKSESVLADIHYEWESELEDYDEPDVYPSEKDYKWVEELVEIIDEEEQKETKEKEESDELKEEENAIPDDNVKPEADESKGVEGETNDSKPDDKKEEKPTDGNDDAEKAEKTEGGEDEENEDVFIQSQPGEEEEEDHQDETPKKKFKTVLVQKLMERPPKIHYEPSEERTEEATDDESFFFQKPFQLLYSFGYDCQRMANLHVLDRETLIFMSGFVLTFFKHETGEKTYLRCLGGSCFGAVAIHPSRKLFAAAEKGVSPILGIWSWPKLQLFRKLQGGTQVVYASVNFSPDGKLLASQGGEPDYLITVWNWLGEIPVLRVKSHAQDVFRVTFSKELAGNLTTSGICHIKFWKMANTFTGLKLKGDIGRFGKTELSDIEGYVEMADGKVVSGSEWGNLLVWENGLIIAEICNRIDYPCHEGIIRLILLHDGAFLTTGQDGWIRTWNYDSVDTAEISTTEDSIKVPLKVMGQTQVDEKADIWYLVGDMANSIFWFAQDGNGYIWRVDLSFLHSAREPQCLLTAHGGVIVTSLISPATNSLFVTLGEDCQIRIYDYTTTKLVACRTFNAPGSCLLWPSIKLDGNKCNTLIAGFADGILRILTLSAKPSSSGLPVTINLESVSKPHSRKITSIAMDKNEEYLVTGGLDGTIFFYDASNSFKPIAFVPMPDYLPVHQVQWAKGDEFREDAHSTVLVVLEGAVIQEVFAPKPEDVDNSESYLHVDYKLLRRVDFQSVKSELRHNEQLESERLEAEEKQKLIDELNRKKLESGEETEEEQGLRLLAEAEEHEIETKRIMEERKKWKPYIPPENSPILLMLQCPFNNDHVILSMGNYDAGYLYTMELLDNEDKKGGTQDGEPISAIPVADSDDVPITSMLFTANGEYMFLGFEDGRIRVQNLIFPFDLNNLGPHWTEGIHDCIRGKITSLSLDPNEQFFISTGKDGNCFLHSLFLTEEVSQINSHWDLPFVEERQDVNDIRHPDAPTLERFKTVEQEMALLAQAKRNKAAKREEISHLRMKYVELIKLNNTMPEDVRLSRVEFAITKDNQMRKELEITRALEELNKMMAWECEKTSKSLGKVKSYYKDVVDGNMFVLKAMTSEIILSSFRIPSFPPFFSEAIEKALQYKTPTTIESDFFEEEGSSDAGHDHEIEPRPKRKRDMDKFVYQKLVRLWKRKLKKVQRQIQWHEFLRTEPTDNDLKEEERAITWAMENMGDMKLKSSADYKVPPEKKLTTHRARKRLVQMENRTFQMRNDFNNKMAVLRNEKIKRIERMQEYAENIQNCWKDMPETERKELPKVPSLCPEEDPESSISYSKEDVLKFKQSIAKQDTLRKVTSASKVKKLEKQQPKKRLLKTSSDILDDGDSQTGGARGEKDRDIGSYVEHIQSNPSPLERQIKYANLRRSTYLQDYYIELIEQEKFHFDVKLKLLRHEKVRLDYLLKVSDCRMVILTTEFIIAQRSEAMEVTIEQRMTKASREKKDCTFEMKSLNKKLETIKRNLEVIAKDRAALLNEVLTIASKTPTFEKYLVKVFKKKIKRAVVKERNPDDSEEEEDSEDSDSDSDSDMIMDEDDDDDDGLDVDLPPSELNKDVYDAVVEVRSRRLDVDDQENTVKTMYDETFTAINELKRRIISADIEFDSSRHELDQFIKDMQSKQNDIDVGISLRLHQIYHLSDDLCKSLCVENETINGLNHRIPELLKERKEEKKKVVETKKTFRQLCINKQHFLERLEEMEKRCDEEMMKKFGAIRPVHELENFTTDPEIVDLQNRLATNQGKNSRELDNMTQDEHQLEHQLLIHTSRESERMLLKAEMLSSITTMQQTMNAYMRSYPSEVEDRTLSREIVHLRKIVLEQWRAIHALNVEIARLSSRPKDPLPPIPEAK